MIEIIVTLVIISILGVIAAPNIKSVMHLEHLNQSASDLVRTLNKAQTRAFFDRRVQTVVLTIDLTSTDTVMSWDTQGKAYLLKDTASVQIFFSKQGLLQAAYNDTTLVGTKSFVVCSYGGTHSRKITINRIGIITDSGLREGCNAN